MDTGLRIVYFAVIFNFWILVVLCVPCKTMPGCECTDNESIVKCENVVSLSGLLGLKPNVVSLTLKNSFLGPTLNTSFSAYIMEVVELDLSGSRIHSITVNVFRYLRNLRKLNLCNNYLRMLEFDVFEHLTALEELDLSYNRFQIFPDRPFYQLRNLRIFNISFNDITNLKLGLRFQVMEHMQVVDLSGNKFHTISADAFAMTASWHERVQKTMILTDCGIKFIEEGAFKNPKGLSTFILNGNTGISLENLSTLFNSSYSPNIKIIDLSNTGLTDVSELFVALRSRNIVEINLSHNNITTLTSELSENLRGTLRKFDVRDNKISSLSAAVAELRSLEYLDMSHNHISQVDSNFDANLVELKYLNLAHNQITTGLFTLQNFVKLEILDLSFNQLSTFVLPNTLNNLRKVSLAGNGITQLDSLNGLINLETFNFQQNKITELKKFLFVDSPSIKIANFSKNEIKKLEDYVFDPHSPKQIDLSYNQIKNLKFPGWENLKVLILRGNGMETVNGEAFHALFHLDLLDLAENALTTIDDITFQYLINLTTLHLEYNQLLGRPSWNILFRSLSMLKFLDLSHNNMSTLESKMLSTCKSLQAINFGHNQIYSIEPSAFKGLKHLKMVDFSVNRFECDCDFLEFRDWLQNAGLIIGHRETGNYTCFSPPEHVGKDISDFKVDDFECDFMYLYIVVYSAVGGIFVVVFLITVFVCHYHLKYRRNELISDVAQSIDFENMENLPFIPDTIHRELKHVKNTEKKKKGHTNKVRKEKDYLKLKKRKWKEDAEMYLMNGIGSQMKNELIPNGTSNKRVNNKTSSKSRSKSKKKTKKRQTADNTYVLRHQNELVIPTPRHRSQSNLELNPYVQQYLWQQHRRQQKNLMHKRSNMGSFRNADVIRPVYGSRSSPDFRYLDSNTLPRSYVDHKFYENYPDTGTWHGPHPRQNIRSSSVDLVDIDQTENRRNIMMSGYNTISGIPSHRSQAHYI